MKNMLRFERCDSYTLGDFVHLISFLRSEDGCPWDRVQTHESIRRNFLEEVYEACEAMDDGDLPHMREELGDVLMQVLFHTDIEREAGHFDIDDVADAACKKLIDRHPHVFGTPEQRRQPQDWEAEKRRERGQTTTAEAMDGVSRALPALWRSDKVQRKAAAVGYEWPNTEMAFSKLPEELGEVREAIALGDPDKMEDELGDLLFATVKLARFLNVDPEKALHRSCDKFIRRFGGVMLLSVPVFPVGADHDSRSKCTALALCALHGDVAVHLPGEIARDGETETGTRSVLCRVPVFLLKRLEYSPKELGAHAAAIVPDTGREAHPVADRLLIQRETDDAAGLREFDSVVQEVHEDLLDADLVADDVVLVDSVCVYMKMNFLLVCEWLDDRSDSLDDVRERAGRLVQLEFAPAHLVDVEDVVDDAEKILA